MSYKGKVVGHCGCEETQSYSKTKPGMMPAFRGQREEDSGRKTEREWPVR